MLSVIVGLTYTIRGREHLDAITENGPCIIACKHQSAFDTIFISLFLDDIVIILKGQLAYVPLFGYYLKKLGSIFIDRENKTAAIRDLIKKSRDAISNKRSIFIFPEGTRAKPGENIPYQRGISLLYRDLNVPVVPVALNTGVFWGRKSPFKYPGNIIIDIQPPISPGLERDQFMEILQETIDTASTHLLDTTPVKQKRSWFKRILTLTFVVSMCVGLTSYLGIKTLIDHKLNQAGIRYTTSKIHFDLRNLPSYELTNASITSPTLPGSLIMAESVRITLTGVKKITVELKNIHTQLYGNIFLTIADLEAFLELYANKISLPYMKARNTIVKIGSFTHALDLLEGTYKQTKNTLNFSCNTPRPTQMNASIIMINGLIEQKDKQAKGEISLQTTFGMPFIDALQQQGVITPIRADELKLALHPIEHESNQNLKQITFPIDN
ncbi:MAG: lysophospholipid acyltransferase family protein [Pseudomonadota bacterium]